MASHDQIGDVAEIAEQVVIRTQSAQQHASVIGAHQFTHPLIATLEGIELVRLVNQRE